MDNYNKCEGCKLWNGHHCTGARSYEPNAEEALNDIKNSFFEDEDKEIITHAESIYYYSKAEEALQKMKGAK